MQLVVVVVVVVVFQLWGYGPRHHRWENLRLDLFAEWGPGDCPPRARHCLQLQSHLSSEPEGRQDEGPAESAECQDKAGQVWNHESLPSIQGTRSHQSGEIIRTWNAPMYRGNVI
ncbi:hypothetical protein chiPu_0024980 [Chiloscyllium punctatum]|uniref:Secreted protein n=1 Tax=Chiloscyllium punctatum TaxID=137246 RepID=A0A401TDY3_CHIPU|nr:hypothetical protein [Chiloscyllium punctatum]